QPHRKTKPFIDKHSAVKFHLVHRSQHDPLLTDETAPQRVLLPAVKNSDLEKRKEQQRDFGVFFDDDYNYLQHLQEASRPAELVSAPPKRAQDAAIEIVHIPAAKVQLPSSVFASEFEEKTGLLNRAAPVPGPRPDWDPDVVAALDDDFNFDDPDAELDDDFVMQANAERGDAEGLSLCRAGDEAAGEWEDVDDSDDMSYDSDGPGTDDGSRGKECLFMDEETKTRFTDYSLTSSVMRRNDQLTLLDDRFEKFFAAYEEDEIGALDHCEVEGSIPAGSTRLQAALDDFHAREQAECVKLNRLWSSRNKEQGKGESEEDDDDMVEVAMEKPAEKWDCESIISTYSTLYNHPKLIEEPSKPSPMRVSRKTGLPLGVLPQRGPTARQVERMGTVTAADLPRAAAVPRAPEETPEQRRARKHAIKEERKDRRLEKKANRMAFKEEKARQEKVVLNLRQNLQGVRL
uniref:Protein LTV1 homolog n=1 Tax=Petromyzon marinus TaxID=7757 RepID=S4RQR4_PETMA